MNCVPAWQVEAGRFVLAELDGVRTLCLKVERQGKDHVNHFLVALDPVADRRAMSLHYLDPEQTLTPVDGCSLDHGPMAGGQDARVGDVLAMESGLWLKLLDAPSSQRLHCFVQLNSGLVKPRLDRHAYQVVTWDIRRI